MGGHDTFIDLGKDHALTMIPHEQCYYSPRGPRDPAHGIHMRSLIVRLGYMAGGVIESAVPALHSGLAS
jgi:hypothetical protein